MSEEGCVCVCVTLCAHAREGRGAPPPSSRLAAVPNFIPSEGLAKCGMRARRRRCQLSKSSSTPGNKKGKLARAKRGPQHRPFPDWALRGRGGRERT